MSFDLSSQNIYAAAEFSSRIDGTCRILCGPREADAIPFLSFAFPFRTWPTLGAIEISTGTIESELRWLMPEKHMFAVRHPLA